MCGIQLICLLYKHLVIANKMIVFFAININKNLDQKLPLTFFEVIGSLMLVLSDVQLPCIIFVYERFLSSI